MFHLRSAAAGDRTRNKRSLHCTRYRHATSLTVGMQALLFCKVNLIKKQKYFQAPPTFDQIYHACAILKKYDIYWLLCKVVLIFSHNKQHLRNKSILAKLIAKFWTQIRIIPTNVHGNFIALQVVSVNKKQGMKS